MDAATLTSVRGAAQRWLPLALIFLAVGLSTAMAAPFLALFLDDAVHADPVHAGAFLVITPVSAVIVSTLVGKVSDRLPARRKVLFGTAVAGCVATAVTAFARDYWVLLAVTVTVTSLAGAMMPQAFAYAREALAGSGRVAMTMSALRTLFSVAWVAGPPLAAALLETGGFTLVYGFASIMYAVAALVVLLALPEADAVRSETAPPQVSGSDAPKLLIWLTLAMFVITRCAGALAVQDLSLFLTRDLSADVGDAGLLLGLCAGLEIPLMLGFGMLSTRMPVRRLLMIGAGCGLAYMVLVAVATDLWQLVAGQVLNAASIAALAGLGMTYVQDMLPRHPGRASTLFSNTFPAGNMLAGPVLGAAQALGYRMPFAIGAALYAVACGLLLLQPLTSGRKSWRTVT